VLAAFTALYDFSDMPFGSSLRKFLTKFRLPGEAQCIDRLMEAFSAMVYKQASERSYFKDADAAFILAFSTIMLNTDLHNPNLPEVRHTKAPPPARAGRARQQPSSLARAERAGRAGERTNNLLLSRERSGREERASAPTTFFSYARFARMLLRSHAASLACCFARMLLRSHAASLACCFARRPH
jgi:hypothetical protein